MGDDMQAPVTESDEDIENGVFVPSASELVQAKLQEAQ